MPVIAPFRNGVDVTKIPQKRGRGRPRRFPTNAARQRAYRQRVKRSARLEKALRSQEYGTPVDLFERYNRLYGFTLDVCAAPDKARCARFFTREQDGLQQDWGTEICWCNPPYTRGMIDQWMRKAHQSAEAGATVVCLVPVKPSTTWWKTFVAVSPRVEIQYLEKRVRFRGMKHNAPFDSAIVIYRPLSAVKGPSACPR